MKWLFGVLTMILLIGLGTSSCTSDSDENSDVSEDAGGSAVASETNANSAENLPWTFLVDGIYHNNATIKVGEQVESNPNEGHWVNFREDGTYEYGVWDKKEYEGSWAYDNNAKLLDLQPNANVNAAASQWRVMHKEDNLILVGTAKFGNNATQMRFVRRSDYPSKN